MPAETPQTIAGLKVLVVDDTEELADILSFVLAREGAEVEVVRDGQAAVERALAGGFGLVLMDVGLPVIDGLEACRRITAEDPSVRVVMLSARDAASDREAGEAAGAIGYLSKPFGPRTLVADLLAVLAASDGPGHAGG